MPTVTRSNLAELIAAGPYAWPGGYPLLWVMADGGQLCARCVERESKLVAAALTEPGTDPQWEPVAVDPYYEGPPVACDHCGQLTESAYGDPDAEGGAA